MAMLLLKTKRQGADTPSSAATSVYTPSPMGDSDYIPSAESTRYMTDIFML